MHGLGAKIEQNFLTHIVTNDEEEQNELEKLKVPEKLNVHGFPNRKFKAYEEEKKKIEQKYKLSPE